MARWRGSATGYLQQAFGLADHVVGAGVHLVVVPNDVRVPVVVNADLSVLLHVQEGGGPPVIGVELPVFDQLGSASQAFGHQPGEFCFFQTRRIGLLKKLQWTLGAFLVVAWQVQETVEPVLVSRHSTSMPPARRGRRALGKPPSSEAIRRATDLVTSSPSKATSGPVSRRRCSRVATAGCFGSRGQVRACPERRWLCPVLS